MGKLTKENNLYRLFGALKNGGAEAKMGILIHLLSPFTLLFDSLPTGKSANNFENVKGVIICGPPRSGSTLIYQAITCALPSVPYTNLHALIPKHASNIIRRHKGRNLISRTQFKNYHGYTSGLFDVNEGNNIFSWAHKSEDSKYLIKNFERIIEILNPNQEEVVTLKNNLAYDVIDRIHQATDGKQFIFIRVQRNIQAIIESVLKVYEETKHFQPIPESLLASEIVDPIEFACQQITTINSILDTQFNKIPERFKLVIQYEDFCINPYEFLEMLAYSYLDLKKGSIRKCRALDSIKVSGRVNCTGNETDRIREMLNHT
jgi:hypothetical protein